MDRNELLFRSINAAFLAGQKILDIYKTDFTVEHKNDNSPLTLADKGAHDIIVERLIETKLPILSEEGRDIPFEERSQWLNFWMVDPLDGTKEFVKRNGEFTVNIALIHGGKPVLGVIWVPVKALLYFGEETLGAYKIENLTKIPPNLALLTNIKNKLPQNTNSDEFIVVASRSHLSVETREFINILKEKHKNVATVSMGSSLKLCLVADGSADIYPRFAPTMEWDTAAGQAIVQSAGKNVRDYTTGRTMCYNKKNLLNNWFVVE